MTGAPPKTVKVDAALARALIRDQFPQWADLPLAPVTSAGTDNALFRLGDEMVVRAPKVDWAAHQPGKEQRWLPMLAPRLPLAIPTPLVLGAPARGYPWNWSVYEWIEGETPTPDYLTDPVDAAARLASFIGALQEIDATVGPAAGDHNHHRGAPLARLDPAIRAALGKLDGKVDVAAASIAWTAALDATPWRGPPVWLHGDLHASNLLTAEDRLSAVIDFGLLGVGDPACDLMVAWTMFSGCARDAFRHSMAVDEATWRRARGWALYSGLIALPYYWNDNPTLVQGCLRTVAGVLADADGAA